MNSTLVSKPRVAVVGCGAWGQNLVRNFLALDVLGLVCDTVPDALRAASKIAPQTEAADSIDTVFSRKDIQAVALATPAQTHAALAQRALAAGKDVFVEKPMTVSASEAEDLVTSAAKLGRILMVGHILLHAPIMRKVKELVDAGEIGRIQHIAVKRAMQGKVRAHENVMWSFACHDIAAVLFLLEKEAPVAMQAIGRSFVQPSIEDDTHLHLDFGDGVSAHIHSSWYWPDNERHYVVLGDQSWLKVDEVAGKITVHRKGIKRDLSNLDNGSFDVSFEATPPLLAECRHFLECIANRTSPRSDGRNGLNVVRILEQATRCLHQGMRPAVSSAQRLPGPSALGSEPAHLV
jgi:predicted dehydrogenase